MKQVVILFSLSLVLYFIDVLVKMIWFLLFIDGTIFTNVPDWLPWDLMLETPPSITLYFLVGWFFHYLHFNRQHVNVLIFAGLIMMWRFVFIQTIWYQEPSIAYIGWRSIIEIIPSVSVLLGFHAYAYKLKNRHD